MATPMPRPLGTGEILDAGMKLYLRHWRVLVTCVVGIVLPVRILGALLEASVNPDALRGSTGLQSRTGGVSSGVVAAELAVLLLAVLTTLLANAACFKAVADAWLGAEPSAERSLRYGLARLPALLLTFVVYILLVVLSVVVLLPGIAIGAGWIALAGLALAVFWIWLTVAESVLVPVVLFERLVAVKALLRSVRLVEDRWWATLATLFVGYVLALIVTALVQAVVLAVPSALTDSTVALAIGNVVGSTLGAMITTPYLAAVVTLLYFDRRLRKEGFDLELLAEGLGAERAPDAPLPAPVAEPPSEEAGTYWLPPEPGRGPGR